MTIRTPIAAFFGAAAALVAVSAVALPAAAAAVTIDTRPWQGIVDPSTFTTSADYEAGWNAVLAANPTAPAGYGNATIADWNGYVSNSNANGGTSSNIAFFDQVTFTVAAGQAGDWSFQIGPDFGFGGTLMVDGTVLDTKTYNMWWGGGNNYGDTWMTLSGDLNLSAGSHTLKVYGFEDCCDGGTGGQFKAPGGVFQDFTTTAGGVPEPAAWALMILGVGGIGASLRHRRATVSALA